jgi:membrane protease YdiL (CAAX protease family)
LVGEVFCCLNFIKNTGLQTSLISGFIWGVYQFCFADYSSGTPSWYAMTCFMVLVIGISFIYTWFRIKSGGLWTAVILHAT